MLKIIATAALGVWALSSVAAIADDWTADQLRGQVLQLVDNQWQPLSRGMVVPDSRVIRTLRNARVTFVRGNETVAVGPNTQIQIYDKGGQRPFTTVKQYFGSVSVEAEVEQVQHFAVQTPYLAAVVKGTRFTVTSDDAGASVSVRRGHVLVDDKEDKTHVTLSVGQSASVGAAGGGLDVTGSGTLPVVLDAHGKPVDSELVSKEIKAAEKAAGKAEKQAEKDAKDAAKADDHGDGSNGGGNQGSDNHGSDNSGSSGFGGGSNSGKGKGGNG